MAEGLYWHANNDKDSGAILPREQQEKAGIYMSDEPPQQADTGAEQSTDGGVTYRDRLREQVAAANGSGVSMERVIARKRVAYQLLHGTLALWQIEKVIKVLSD